MKSAQGTSVQISSLILQKDTLIFLPEALTVSVIRPNLNNLVVNSLLQEQHEAGMAKEK